MRLDVLVYSCVLGTGVALQQQPPPPPPPPSQQADPAVYRSAVEIVALNVTVTDQRLRFVSDLDARDFTVFEDGVAQAITHFAAGRLPLDLAVLLDTSASMSHSLATAQKAATGFVQALRPGDRVAIMGVTSRAEFLLPLTDELAAAVGAIRRTTARGTTSLYNAVYIAVTEMARNRRDAAYVRRQAIAVLSDGEDTSSLVEYDDVLELARESGVAVYTIALVPRTRNLWLPTGPAGQMARPQFIMRTFAQETGARAFVATEGRALEGIYASITDELASQYTVGYVPTNTRRDGTFRHVIVNVVGRSDVTARTRNGYRASGPR